MKTRLITRATGDIERRGHRDEREGVGRAVAHLAVVRVGRERKRRQVDGGEQLAVFQHRVTLWLVARQAVEVHERDRPFPLRPQHAHTGIECGQRDRHVRGMRGDARLRCSKDREFAVIALARGTAAARHTLVAGLGDVLEVDAARALQQVTPGGGQVTELARGAREQRLGEQGIAGANRAIGREIAVAHHCPDTHASTGERFDAVIGQAGDIDQQIRLPHPQPHMVDEVRPSGEEDPVRRLGEERDGAGGVRWAFVAEGIHRRASSACLARCASCACWMTSLIAGTMLA